METHSWACHGTVWFLRGLAIWLLLSALFGLASMSVLLNHETAIAFLGMRCPSCGASLESSRPRTCRKCGIPLFID